MSSRLRFAAGTLLGLLLCGCPPQPVPRADPVAPCGSDADCARLVQPCVAAACVAKRCQMRALAPGSLPADTAAGDCQRPVCGEEGAVLLREAPDDLPPRRDDPCREPACQGGDPRQALVGVGHRCGKRGVCGVKDGYCVVAEQIVIGSYHSCARFQDGRVSCWGIDRYGAVSGEPGGDIQPLPRLLPGIEGATQLAVGTMDTCAIVVGGRVQCWGTVSMGGRSAAPHLEEVKGLAGSEQIVLEAGKGCARTRDGGVRCWSNETEQRASEPVALSGGAVSLGVGAGRVCAALESGEVDCWSVPGDRSGRASAPARVVRVGVARGATRMALNSAFVCALDEWGVLACWPMPASLARLNTVGTNPAFAPYLKSPGLYPDADDIREFVTAPPWHTCVLRASGEIDCMGPGFPGEEAAAVPDPLEFRKLEGLGRARSIALGAGQLCAISRDGVVRCMGANSYRQLGSEASDTTLPPTPVAF